MRIACVRLSSWRLTRFPLLWREAVIHSAARPLVCTAAGAAGSNPAPSASSRLHHEVNQQPPYLSTWRSPPTLTRPSSPSQPRVHNFRLLPSLRVEATASKYNNATCFFTAVSNKNRNIAIPPRLIWPNFLSFKGEGTFLRSANQYQNLWSVSKQSTPPSALPALLLVESVRLKEVGTGTRLAIGWLRRINTAHRFCETS